MVEHQVRVVVRGRVQGVWYRGWMVDQARSLGLRGWVRNRDDGSVEGLLAGPESQVREMVQQCHAGPPAARVSEVEEHPADREPVPEGFDQRPTA